MTRLIIVRHAEAEGNYIRRFHGWTDSELTEKGHKQAALAAEALKDTPIDVIYSSSMKRTLATAKYIAEVKKLPIIRTDKLKEINGGDWENRLWTELPEKWPEQYETWESKPHIHRMPNGESMEEFQERLVKEIHRILVDNKGRNICVVTHGTAIKAMLCYFYGKSLEELFVNLQWHDNTSIAIVEVDDDKINGKEDGKAFRVVQERDSSHLGDLGTVENQDWWKELGKKKGRKE